MPDRLDVTSQVFNTAQHPDLFRPTVARVGVTRWLPRAASHHERTCGVGWWSVPRVAISRKLMTTSHGISRLRTLVMPVRAIAQVALALAPLGGSSVDVCVEQLCGTADRRSTGGDQRVLHLTLPQHSVCTCTARRLPSPVTSPSLAVLQHVMQQHASSQMDAFSELVLRESDRRGARHIMHCREVSPVVATVDTILYTCASEDRMCASVSSSRLPMVFDEA
ncbi:hypothetical protein PINS_up013047 [Pythium insidiosum]|nr:hypothetical protein PINS_up013047 [Pythium insidiosum]